MSVVADAVEVRKTRILGIITNPYMTRDDIALAYAELLRDRTIQEYAAAVNAAIVKRWSVSGLKYIKRKAWRGGETMSR